MQQAETYLFPRHNGQVTTARETYSLVLPVSLGALGRGTQMGSPLLAGGLFLDGTFYAMVHSFNCISQISPSSFLLFSLVLARCSLRELGILGVLDYSVISNGLL